jgi:hypothetical protein
MNTTLQTLGVRTTEATLRNVPAVRVRRRSMKSWMYPQINSSTLGYYIFFHCCQLILAMSGSSKVRRHQLLRWSCWSLTPGPAVRYKSYELGEQQLPRSTGRPVGIATIAYRSQLSAHRHEFLLSFRQSRSCGTGILRLDVYCGCMKAPMSQTYSVSRLLQVTVGLFWIAGYDTCSRTSASTELTSYHTCSRI